MSKSSISIGCFTNLDGYDAEQWPDTFLCRPIIGDYVSSLTGKRLRIVTIIHRKDRLVIELHN